MLKQDDTKAQSRIKVAPKQMVQVHYKNFGAKTAVRCGWISGRYNCQSHIHQYAELVYVAEGEMTVTVDSVSRVMRSGDFAIIAPFRIHSFSTPESVRRWVCVFSDEFIRHLVTEDELYGLSTNFTFTASAGLVEYAAPMMLEAGERFINLDAVLIRRFKALITAVYEEYMRNAGEVRSEQRKNAPFRHTYIHSCALPRADIPCIDRCGARILSQIRILLPLANRGDEPFPPR